MPKKLKLTTYEPPEGSKYLVIQNPWGLSHSASQVANDERKLAVAASSIAGWLRVMFADDSLEVEAIYMQRTVRLMMPPVVRNL
jgi:hypothetical protein